MTNRFFTLAECEAELNALYRQRLQMTCAGSSDFLRNAVNRLINEWERNASEFRDARAPMVGDV